MKRILFAALAVCTLTSARENGKDLRITAKGNSARTPDSLLYFISGVMNFFEITILPFLILYLPMWMILGWIFPGLL